MAGLAAALPACAIIWALGSTGLPALAVALLAILAQILATGALHEDGLADWADGMGARGGPQERLAAMRDSHTGAFGLIALIFSITLRAAALSALASPMIALILAAMASRATMPLIMAVLPHARSDGLSHLTGRPAGAIAALALALGLIPLALATCALWPVLAASAAALPAIWAARRIKGQTGDILGAAQQCAEIAILLALAAIAT